MIDLVYLQCELNFYLHERNSWKFLFFMYWKTVHGWVVICCIELLDKRPYLFWFPTTSSAIFTVISKCAHVDSVNTLRGQYIRVIKSAVSCDTKWGIVYVNGNVNLKGTFLWKRFNFFYSCFTMVIWAVVCCNATVHVYLNTLISKKEENIWLYV